MPISKFPRSLAAVLLILPAGSGSPLVPFPDRHMSGPDRLEPAALAAGDFDKNGADDLLVLHRSGLSLLLNRPGQIPEEKVILQGQDLTNNYELWGEQLAAGDLDGDGNPDFAAITNLDWFTRKLAVFFGNGDGSFQPGQEFLFNSLYSVAAEDVDGDGRGDLILCGRRESDGFFGLMVLLSRDPRGFIESYIYTFPSQVKSAVVLHGIGGERLIAASAGGIYLTQLFPEGGIGMWEAVPEFSTKSAVLSSGDLDGDGRDELLLRGQQNVSLGIAWGSRVEKPLYEGRSVRDAVPLPGKAAVAEGDFDALVLLTLDQGLEVVRSETYAAGGMPQCLGTGDLNGDGVEDIAVGLHGALWHDEKVWGSVVYALSGDDGLLAPRNFAPLDGHLRDAGLVDLDGDGDLDAACSLSGFYSQDGRGVIAVLERKNGAWEERLRLDAPNTPGKASFGDLNQDGLLDIVLVNSPIDYPTTDSVLVCLAQNQFLFDGPVPVKVGDFPSAAEVRDLDGDGILDLAVTAYGCQCYPGNSSQLAVLMGKGDGTFEAPLLFPAAHYAQDLILMDLNGDGRIDALVLAYPNPQDWKGSLIFEGDGSGNFVLSGEAIVPFARTMARADVDLDGAEEIVFLGNDISICEATVEGLRNPVRISLDFPEWSFSGKALAVGDGNGDGIPDILFSSLYSDLLPQDRVHMLPGQGGGLFGGREEILSGNGTARILVDSVDPGNEPVVTLAGSLYEHRTSFLVTLPRSGSGGPRQFIRGDSNGDRALDLSDAVKSLFALFLGDVLRCEDAADPNDDGALDISDPVYLLAFLFTAGPPPEPPFPAPGEDGTPDGLGCAEY